ncbi:MAG: GntR family transcriptional regulator [Planctomycetota bacterium]|nr:GntR family transcriptional regulator [Planctomycetota bacterium]
MQATSLESNTASQRAYDYVRLKLENGDYPPGTRLVTRTIAKEIGSSLNPVREALGRLSTQGLIDHVPGSGSSVRQPNQKEIVELYGLREALESQAAYIAATNIQANELAELTTICENWQQLANRLQSQPDTSLDDKESRRQWIESEKRFHRIVIEAARNDLLAQVCEDYLVLSSIFKRHLQQPALLTPELVSQVAKTHTALVESLRAGDAESARRQTAAMIQHGFRNTLRLD